MERRIGAGSFDFQTGPSRKWLKLMVGIVVVLRVMGCSSSTGATDSDALLYPLAHNTERAQIITETTGILQLYDFTIEYTDLNRDRSAMQTYWRTVHQDASPNEKTIPVWIRDRAILHISPRGRSTIQQNVYLMVNATLQFEIQMRLDSEDEWNSITPTKEYKDQYAAIIKDIRNRMLRYRYEF